jgi:hypothetical protein
MDLQKAFNTPKIDDINYGENSYGYMFKIPQISQEQTEDTVKYSGCLYNTTGDIVCPNNKQNNAWTITKDGYAKQK